jgi:hypothetical protein
MRLFKRHKLNTTIYDDDDDDEHYTNTRTPELIPEHSLTSEPPCIDHCADIYRS